MVVPVGDGRRAAGRAGEIAVCSAVIIWRENPCRQCLQQQFDVVAFCKRQKIVFFVLTIHYY